MPSISWNAHAPSVAQDHIGTYLLEFFNCPSTLGEAITRMKHNLYYYRISYSMITLFILLISVLWHPLSIVIFAIFFFGMLIGHCCNQDLIELLKGFLTVLWVVTPFALLSTGFWLNVLVSISIGCVVVGTHAVFRSTDDQYVELLP
ncbi:PRA1 family protein E-like [Ziziphus jujuba]|uniref:PRA1 family protein n=1 Tax=Ziziphus jujuba TaxID=326968 RepID=A0ABM4AHX4_ZIZJJ|nr:PRA1 family protein E-like [Ziziphus jujuba]